MRPRNRSLLGLAVFAWFAALAVGFGSLARYSAEPGAAQPPPVSVEQFVAQHRTAGRGLIVMAVHPRCPCSRASLGELGDLLARADGACTALLLEFQPTDASADWPAPASHRTLGGVDVPVVADPAGRIAAALGARTSGHLIFADAQGTVRFHGGLTVARGHRGRSAGQDAILAALNGQATALHAAPVHGCALLPECAPGSLE